MESQRKVYHCQLLLLLLLIFSSALIAHEMRPAALQITEVSPAHFQVRWKVPAKAGQRLALYVLLDGQPAYQVQAAQFIPGAYIETGAFYKRGGLVDSSITIQGLESTFTDVLLRLQHLDGTVMSARLSPENPSYQFQAQASGLSLIQTYTQLGVQHILLGTDHLLFVACIVLVAGFSRRLIWAITGFSLAHSLTLGLAALELIRLPAPAVEAVIALSILFMAGEIARGKTDTLSHRYPVLVSSGFGLLHGFGFAAVLTEIGLPKGEGLLALLCFNLGVEIGQLVFIAALYLCFRLIRKSRQLPWAGLKKTSSYIIGSVAFMWLIERVWLF